MAKLATKEALKEVDNLKKKREIILKKELEQAEQISEKFKDAIVEMSGKANESGKLFASIGRGDLIDKIKHQFGVTLDKDMIKFDEGEHLKQVGEHEVKLQLTPDIASVLKIVVRAE